MSLVTRNALIALMITVALIATVAFAVGYLNRARINELEAIENQISIDTLSLDTQFSLLESAPCENLDENAGLTRELAELGDRLSFAENQLGSDNAQVERLKKQYSLLEIRDFLITKKLASACKLKPVTVLYFYSNKGDCNACARAGYALSYLHNTYPSLRVYSFDYHLELGALKTLIAVQKMKGDLPAFVINGIPHAGFTSLEDLESWFPKGALATTSAATSTATSTVGNR